VRKLSLPVRTPRLSLREFTAQDFEAILAYSSDPKVTRYLFFGPRDADSTQEYLQELLASQRETPRTRFELAVEQNAGGRLIGACDLSLIERNVMDLGYMLESGAWGLGYAT
jgi:RimJ/RimL family protein N-acetyltransferase